MSKIKPTLPRGTRDFSPETMSKRNYILGAIKKTFEKFGFQPLETPAVENLSVLTGKYGEEGDKLIYKILNSGDYLGKVDPDGNYFEKINELTSRISEKGLRYDLTVPFARYVVMNRNDITLPFKRYQVQPVWRADRPQKGRYREFYQCDADVIGTNALLCEAEICLMVKESFTSLDLNDYVLKINSRKILEGLAETAGDSERSDLFFVILDKLDKIGLEKVQQELSGKDFSAKFISKISEVISFRGNNEDKIAFLEQFLSDSEIGRTGINEIQSTISYVKSLYGEMKELEFDITLARGLSYYTGIIFEAKALNVRIGSIGGGGRYDNLTGVFGLADMSGVGFSFGIDRIYDVMDELSLFDDQSLVTTKVMIANFDNEAENFSLQLLTKLREAGVNTEFYPDNVKLKKQLNYANKKGIPYVLMIGSEELKEDSCTLKDMVSGEQKTLPVKDIIASLS